MNLTRDQIAKLNAEVDHVAIWTSDQTQYLMSDYWEDLKANTDGTLTGDCEDYCLTKLHLLLANGQPIDSCRFVLVQTDPAAKTEFDHLVLKVTDADNGDLILDQRYPKQVIKLEEYPDFIYAWGLGVHWMKVKASEAA